MGRIKTKNIKNVTFSLLEAYPNKFTKDFEKNKEVLKELNIIRDKSVRNRIAGYLTKVNKRKSNQAI